MLPQNFIYDESYYMKMAPGDVITNTVVNCLYVRYLNQFEIPYDTKSLPLGQYTISVIHYGLYDNVEYFELVEMPEPIFKVGVQRGFFAGRFITYP